MLLNWSRGKIYKIVGPGDMVYIGSTTESIHTRFEKHILYWHLRKPGNRIAAWDLFDEYGPENCKIVLLELVDAPDWNTLRVHEQYWINRIPCINKNRAFRYSGKFQYQRLMKTLAERNHNQFHCNTCGYCNEVDHTPVYHSERLMNRISEWIETH